MSTTQQNDDQAFGILEWVMTQFGSSFSPEKIAQLEVLYKKAKQVQAEPWQADAEYDDPIIDGMARWLYGLSRPFDVLFALACNEVVKGTITVKKMFFILLRYSGLYGGLTIQGRSDWALHFILGGAIEATLGMGERAGRFKEWRDAVFGGDVDPNDYAATLAGSMFVQKAADSEWLRTWSDGTRRLTTNLPEFNYHATTQEVKDGVFSETTMNQIQQEVERAEEAVVNG